MRHVRGVTAEDHVFITSDALPGCLIGYLWDLQIRCGKFATEEQAGNRYSSNPQTSFTIEFIRIVNLLTNRADLHAELLQSGMDLTREHLDLRQPRDAFCTIVVASVFNDLYDRPVFSFLGRLEGINSTLLPHAESNCFELRINYYEAQSRITTGKYQDRMISSLHWRFLRKGYSRRSIGICKRQSDRVFYLPLWFGSTDVLDFKLKTVPTNCIVETW